MWQKFGTEMGEYGEKSYPKYFPDQKIKIKLLKYKNGEEKSIIIGEGIICDSIVFDGKKPYLVKITKYGEEDNYNKYNEENYYNGNEIKKNGYILLSEKNIQLIS